MYGPGGRKRFFVGDNEVSPEEYAATVHPWKIKDLLAEGRAPGGTQPRGWPLTSVALAVQPDQIAEATARNKRHGCRVGYTPEGKAVIPDAGEYRRLRKLEGVFDKDSFI